MCPAKAVGKKHVTLHVSSLFSVLVSVQCVEREQKLEATASLRDNGELDREKPSWSVLVHAQAVPSAFALAHAQGVSEALF